MTLPRSLPACSLAASSSVGPARITVRCFHRSLSTASSSSPSIAGPPPLKRPTRKFDRSRKLPSLPSAAGEAAGQGLVHRQGAHPAMQQKPGSSLEPNLDGQDGPGVGVADQVKNAFPSQRRERGEALDRPYDFSSPNSLFNAFKPIDEDVLSYRRVTSADVAHYRDPPTRVKMLVRDYIDDHLYNPNYGYFSSRSLEIFKTPTEHGYDFTNFRSSFHFTNEVARGYDDYLKEEDKARAELNARVAEARAVGEPFPVVQREQREGKQIWHTPTELFKPWFGRAVARCLIADYKLKHFPYDDFVLYEMGAGNGTLMSNILDYLREEEPEVYERTQYRIIEISPVLAEKQLKTATVAGHDGIVHIVNKSIFEWDEVVSEPCYFVAMEVLDNFAHDEIAYHFSTGLPVQAVITTDEEGDFQKHYEPITDPLIAKFLALRSQLPRPLNHSPAFPWYMERFSVLRRARAYVPAAPNLTQSEYIPTKALRFMEILRDYFPSHRLMVADFNALPDAIKGYNAPVVQTRHRGEMIPVSTIMVRHGYFDIFFPTNFPLFRSLYKLVLSLPPNSPQTPPSLLNHPPLIPPTPLISPLHRDHDWHHRRSSSSGPLPLQGSSSILPADFAFPNPRVPITTGEEGASEQQPVAGNGRKQAVGIWTHEAFLTKWAERDEQGKSRTTVKDGTDVMTSWFQNASFLF